MNGRGNREVQVKPKPPGPDGFPLPSDFDGPPANVSGCIDLHMHSTCSDGAFEPEFLVRWAAKLGLKAIALTDHDTMKGVRRAMTEGARLGIEVIPGCEISVAYSQGTFHLLAYFVEPENRQFTDRLDEIAHNRHARNQKIVAKLGEFGMAVTYGEIRAEAGEAVTGRPHIARVLLKRGYVKSIQEAFDLWLGDDRPCYFEKETFGPREAIEHVRRCGGVPVMAHPYWLNRKNVQDLEVYLAELKDLGLMGVECVYSDHSSEFQRQCIEIAHRLGLVVTGGADFHGGVTKPEVSLGSGPGGGFKVPAELLEGLKRAAAKARVQF
ncbi:MAG: PHP domain-containing protein [Planctomycetaceae bacterium]|nr:phosphoesterase [Planctomycetota bacterium]NUO15407.1 PHP domain-containing protein [Planctomycetaceae bacterium]GIK51528.1 MAG: phosphatase [Planctomycetota bacterium]